MIDEAEPYRGPFVVIEPEPHGHYRVSIDPMTGLDLSRRFDGKNAAWSYARDLWSIFRLPLRDLTDGNVARDIPKRSTRKIVFSLNRARRKKSGKGEA
jgi:hypothetical protein